MFGTDVFIYKELMNNDLLLYAWEINHTITKKSNFVSCYKVDDRYMIKGGLRA